MSDKSLSKLGAGLRPLKSLTSAAAQVTRYVEREILNHRRLIHPHIVEMREVTDAHLCLCLW